MGQTNKGSRELVHVPVAREVLHALDLEAPAHYTKRGPFVADMIATFFGFFSLPSDFADSSARKNAPVKDVRTLCALPVSRPAYDAVLAHADRLGVSLADCVSVTLAHELGIPECIADLDDLSQEMLPIGSQRADTPLGKATQRVPVRIATEVFPELVAEAKEFGTPWGRYAAEMMAYFFGMPEHVSIVKTLAALPVRRSVYLAIVEHATERGVSLADCVTITLADAFNSPELATVGAEQQMLAVGGNAAA
ncbi:hypothetical protein [Nocardia brasiliensis]|uniref:hypothetical protein n=1 Tax=Nocardia brasiliensis TaxID=37326 RepID=UPI003D910163